ncbi:hypothetical protein C1H59_03650 [Clostridium sp. 3-3]|nr:hypothetical protein C1H59_03650 [Clostridium sp. 3-3]
MKLDYSYLISPYPYYLMLKTSNSSIVIGGIKSPTLREIWSPDITYQRYQIFISQLLMNPQKYYEDKPEKLDWYNSLNKEEQNRLDMMHIIEEDVTLQKDYERMLNFFFVENVFWNTTYKVFFVLGNNTYYDKEKQYCYTITEGGEKKPTNNFGYISKNTLSIVCDIILQRCGVNNNKNDEKPKFKNKMAEYIWNKQHNDTNKSKLKGDKYLELPNIISSYSSFNHSNIGILNIWDMTIYQLCDQFQRERFNNCYDISKYQVGYYGDKDDKFDSDKWLKSINI